MVQISSSFRVVLTLLALGLPCAADEPISIEPLEERCRELVERGLFREAEPLVQERLRRLEADPAASRLALAQALVDLARIRMDQDDFPAADSLLSLSLELRRARFPEESPEVATGKQELGRLWVQRGKGEEAERLCREALATRLELGQAERHEIVSCRLALADVLAGRGKTEEMSEQVEQSLALLQSGVSSRADSLLLASTLVWSAMVDELRGDYRSAEKRVYRAHDIQLSILGPESGPAATTLNQLGALRRDQGDFPSALEYFEETLAMRRRLFGKEHWSARQAANNVAVVLNDLERYAEAEVVLRELVEIVERIRGRNHPRDEALRINLGESLRGQGKYEQAREIFEGILERDPGNERFTSSISFRLASIAFEREEFAEAESLWSETMAAYDERHPAAHRDRASARLGFAKTLAVQGKTRAAAEKTREAAAMYERLRIDADAGARRATFMRSPYEQLAALELELGRGREAWTAVERSRGLTLADLLAAARSRRLTAAEEERERELARALAAAESRWGAERATGSESSIRDARAELLRAEADWARFRDDLSARHPVAEGHALDLAVVQRSIPEDTALVGWLDCDFGHAMHPVWGYVVLPKGEVLWERLAIGDLESSPDPVEAPRRFHDLILAQADEADLLSTSDRRALDHASKELWDVWLAPLVPHLLGVTNLVVISSRAMSGVPVEALHDEAGRYAGDRFVVTYAPSASLYASLKGLNPLRDDPDWALVIGDPPFRDEHLAMISDSLRPVTAAGQFDVALLRSAVAGDPVSLAKLPRLPFSRTEVDALTHLFPDCVTLVGAAATENALETLARREELERFDVLHFATHALVDDEQPQRSALVLSQPNARASSAYDGLVTAAEIVREWRLDADLVTLSACRTAMGRKTQEGTEALATAFLRAGARSLLVSLWNVDDEATSLLMRRFYEEWLGSEPISRGEALRRARAWLREQRSSFGTRFDHPYYWSAFVLIGASP